MPAHYLIALELTILLLVTLAGAAVLLRVLMRARDGAQQLAGERARIIKRLGKELKESQIKIDELLAAATAAAAESDNGLDFNAMLGDLGNDLQGGSDSLYELCEIQDGVDGSVGRLEQMQADTTDNWDQAALQKELKVLREQSGRSGRVINVLTKALESTRAKLKAIQLSAPRRQPASRNTEEVEKNSRRLAIDNKALQQKLQKEMVNHKESVDRLANKLRETEESKRSLMNEASQQRKSMSMVIDELQKQLHEASAALSDNPEVQALRDKLQDMSDALDRAIKERDFLDSRFIELEQALDNSEAAAEALERAKTEYRMLEDRYLDMENELDEDAKPVAGSRTTRRAATVIDLQALTALDTDVDESTELGAADQDAVSKS